MFSLDRRAINFSHGAQWKALISTYMAVMPLSGEADPAEQIIGAASPSPIVSSAIAANVGDAARLNQWAAPNTPLLSLMPAFPL